MICISIDYAVEKADIPVIIPWHLNPLKMGNCLTKPEETTTVKVVPPSLPIPEHPPVTSPPQKDVTPDQFDEADKMPDPMDKASKDEVQDPKFVDPSLQKPSDQTEAPKSENVGNDENVEQPPDGGNVEESQVVDETMKPEDSGNPVEAAAVDEPVEAQKLEEVGDAVELQTVEVADHGPSDVVKEEEAEQPAAAEEDSAVNVQQDGVEERESAEVEVKPDLELERKMSSEDASPPEPDTNNEAVEEVDLVASDNQASSQSDGNGDAPPEDAPPTTQNDEEDNAENPEDVMAVMPKDDAVDGQHFDAQQNALEPEEMEDAVGAAQKIKGMMTEQELIHEEAAKESN